MMKIAQVIPAHPLRGGIEVLAMELSKALKREGHEVEIFCFDDSLSCSYSEGTHKGVFVRMYKPLFEDPLCIPPPKLIRDLHERKIDIIHVHNVHTLLPLFIINGVKRPSKLVLQPHYHRYGQSPTRNILFSLYKAMLLPTVLRCFDAIIANSEYEATCIKKDFPEISQKVILMPEEYSIEIPSSTKWDPLTNVKRILYVGALRSYKNVDVLIYALKIISAKRKNVKLVLIGEGPEEKKLRRLAQRLGVYELIMWRRGLEYDELLQEYAKASVVVVLSQLESFSRVAHEAIAIGVPLIVYQSGPLRGLVERGLARGIHDLNPISVANAIEEVLDDRWRRNTAINSHAREISRQYFVEVMGLYRRLYKETQPKDSY
jgi:glycosyltransferase involved in cell wall biosynthesis